MTSALALSVLTKCKRRNGEAESRGAVWPNAIVALTNGADLRAPSGRTRLPCRRALLRLKLMDAVRVLPTGTLPALRTSPRASAMARLNNQEIY